MYQNKQKLKTLIDQKFKKTPWPLWGTRIYKAQKLALDKLFTPSGGDRPEATNVMLIFTDGDPTELEESDFTPFKELRDGLEVKKLLSYTRFSCQPIPTLSSYLGLKNPIFNHLEATPRAVTCHRHGVFAVVPQTYFAGKLVQALRNVGCFLRLPLT